MTHIKVLAKIPQRNRRGYEILSSGNNFYHSRFGGMGGKSRHAEPELERKDM